MGLDMYLSGEKYFVQDFDKTVPVHGMIDTNEGRPLDAEGEHMESAQYRLGYWRKFAPLHHFVVNEFADGVDDCRRIGLGRDDLLKIADVIEAASLPPDDQCGGCFFGSSEIWEYHRSEAKDHAATFRAAADWIEAEPKYDSGALKQWRSVYYEASW